MQEISVYRKQICIKIMFIVSQFGSTLSIASKLKIISWHQCHHDGNQCASYQRATPCSRPDPHTNICTHTHIYYIFFLFTENLPCSFITSEPLFLHVDHLDGTKGQIKSNQIKYIICIFLVRYIPKENCAGNSSSQPSVYGWLLLSKKTKKEFNTKRHYSIHLS